MTFATILGAVVLWVFGDSLGIPAVQAAMLALSTLLATGAALRCSNIVALHCTRVVPWLPDPLPRL